MTILFIVLAFALGFLAGVYRKTIAQAFHSLGYSPVTVEDYTRTPYDPPRADTTWKSETTVEVKTETKPVETPAPVETPPEHPEVTLAKKIADTRLPLADRLNLRYDFADVKISDKLGIIAWTNYAGKRMQSKFDGTWRGACTLIEDSLHDIKNAS